MADNIERTDNKETGIAPAPANYLSEPAKEAKMGELDPAEIASLAFASLSGTPLPKHADIENGDIVLPLAETLLAAGKVLVERFKKEWKEDAEAHDLAKVDYPRTGMRIQIVKSAKTPEADPEALLELRKKDPVAYAKICKPGIHAPASKKKALQERIDKLQGELLKAQTEMEAYDLYDSPELIDDPKAIAEAVGDWDGITWVAKRADSVREGSIPKGKRQA